MEFPPPKKGEKPSLGKEGYRTAQPGAKFILPPPSRPDSYDTDAALLEVAETIAQWGDTADWAAGQAQNLGEVVTDYGTAIEDLGKDRVMPWAVPTVAPLSQSINRRADATFQLQGFMSLDNPLAGNTKGEDGHFHALTGTHPNAGRVETRLAEGWNVGNRTYLAFVTPSVTRLYNGIDFMVGATSGTPAILDFALFRTDENRQLTSLIGTQRVEPAEVGTGRQVISRTFTPTLVQQGEYIAIAVRQFSSGEQRPLLGVFDVDRPLKNSTFPRKITGVWNSTSAIPSVIDGENDVDFTADWFIPYIELSEDVGIDYRVFNDPWPNVGEAPRPWVAMTARGINSQGGYTAAAGVGIRVSMYDSPLSTDRVRIRSSIYQDSSSGTVRRSTLIFRGTSDLRSGIGLSVLSRTRYELIRWSNLNVDSNEDWDDRTVVATIDRVPQRGDQIEIDYLDGSVSVRINGVTQVDSLVVDGPVGAQGRFVGIQNRRQAFITASWSPWFGPWSARDLPLSGGGDGDDDEDGDGEGGTG